MINKLIIIQENILNLISFYTIGLNILYIGNIKHNINYQKKIKWLYLIVWFYITKNFDFLNIFRYIVWKKSDLVDDNISRKIINLIRKILIEEILKNKGI